ncbi:hydrolase [Flavobacterium sp. GSN2]|nr:hydrolase [Flavobacterium sp. GSN2]
MKNSFLFCFLALSFIGYSQKKVLHTKFISDKITIDGNLNEATWQSAAIATDFIMFEPDNGKKIPDNKRTEVRIVYDNDALYIGATMYDENPDKILREITQRDNFGTADLFGVFINGFNDGQQDFQFFVNAADGQADCIMTDTNGEDYSWDAVWNSKAVITKKGWIVEMRIPYAALRFSGEKKQTWGLNFFREIRRDRHKYTWNFIDSKLGTFTQQTGILEGIENIKPPTRLFLLPYSSFYVNANSQEKTIGTLKGGLDLKYGINDAFTLDMILVPDFGQTKFDDKILNLGPFEQQFNENRPFFTEGTDLFSKGNLLYSRRIGGTPSYKLNENESFAEAPNISLINAFKISGRTKDGLGIGILNAVTKNTPTTIFNNESRALRTELEPLANYSVLVLDQRFRKNSSVAFVNTNVTRNGHFRDGNVTALVWDLNTKKNTYNISGDFKYSYINDTEEKTGINSQLNFSETSGKFRYGLGADITTKNFDNNDLGINFETNYYSIYGNSSYRILNPTKYFNTFNARINMYSQFQKETGKVQSSNISFQINSNNKKNHYFGMGIDANPLETFDYYEPRSADRFVIKPTKIGGFIYLSSNYNNPFAINFNPSFAIFDETGRNSYGFSLGPRYRFSDKISLNYNFNFLRQNNNKGYVDSVNDDMNATTPNTIVFANRNVITYSNTLSGKYSLNSQMTFNLSIRQYWSYAENKNALSLQQNGRLANFMAYTSNKNSSFYSWNTDLSYSWWFAPGSQVSVLYRNNAAAFERNINKEFGENVTNLLNNEALSHVFSISIRYFIDYNEVKNKF